MTTTLTDLNEYWRAIGSDLSNSLNKARTLHGHSGIKGSLNEDALADVLDENFYPKWTARRSTVMDSEGHKTGEVDVALCNQYQPIHKTTNAILLAEGVDVVVEVKTRLNKAEIESIVAKCREVKSCVRKFSQHDRTFSHKTDLKPFVERIPFFVFCYESDLTAHTAGRHLKSFCGRWPNHLQPDGIFVLDKFTIGNVRDNQGSQAVYGNHTGFVMDHREDFAIINFAMSLMSAPPIVARARHPILKYNLGHDPNLEGLDPYTL